MALKLDIDQVVVCYTRQKVVLPFVSKYATL